jgi:hypothetical protein
MPGALALPVLFIDCGLGPCNSRATTRRFLQMSAAFVGASRAHGKLSHRSELNTIERDGFSALQPENRRVGGSTPPLGTTPLQLAETAAARLVQILTESADFCDVSVDIEVVYCAAETLSRSCVRVAMTRISRRKKWPAPFSQENGD